MSDENFDRALRESQQIVDKQVKDAQERKAIEDEKTAKEKEQERQEQLKWDNEEKRWSRGYIAPDVEKFKEYIAKGHKVTADCCGASYKKVGNEAPGYLSFCQSVNFEEIFTIACENGLSKDDAERLLKLAFTPKALGILIEKGGADIQKYPMDEVRQTYNRYDVIAEQIEDVVREVIKRGYDIKKSPEHAESFNYLLKKIKEREARIADQQRLAFEERARTIQMKKEQKSKGEFYKVDDKRKVITYDPGNNNYGRVDKDLAETSEHMIAIANKTGYSVEAKFNDALFCVKPGMTSDQVSKVYNIALRQRYRDASDPHFSVDYNVYTEAVREKVEDKLYDIEGSFDIQFDPESKAKLSQDKEHNILCYNDNGTLRWSWNPKEDVFVSYNDKDSCPYHDFEGYEGLRKIDNKLAMLRRKLAKRADKILGTSVIENKKMPEHLKKVEKIISDKVLGKMRG